jgi:hypothetical protein
MAKKMELGLDDEDGKENQILNYQHWNLYKGQPFDLFVSSNANISKEEKNFLLKILKKEKTNIYIVFDKKGKDKNSFIDWLFKNWKESIYSLIYLDEIEDRDILFKRILKKPEANSIRELKIHFNINKDEKVLLFKNFLPNCSNLKTLSLNSFPGEKEGYGNFLINCKELENIDLDFDYKKIETLNYMILDNNKIKLLKLTITLESSSVLDKK